jgi:hypothetical protein
VTRFALVLAVVVLATSPIASAAEPPPFAKDLTFESEAISLVDTGSMKARALLTTVTIAHFAKYVARDHAEQPHLRLLVLRLGRKLSAQQLQQVFRGVVRGRSGYTDTQLSAFLALLPSAQDGSTLRFRSNATGKLEVFAGDALAGSVVAPQLAAAVWEGFGGGTGTSPSVPPN